MKPVVQFRMRFVRDGDIAIGPGKVALLEAIGEAGSLSAAARQLGMSYRRAWLLIDQLNRCLRTPAVSAASGGARGGGTVLTPTGRKLIKHYRAIEAASFQAAAPDIDGISRLLAP